MIFNMKIKYYKRKLENLLVIDKIVTIHYLELAKDFNFREESHDFWEIVYSDKESVIANSDDNKITLEEGEMIFHKPSERHSLAADGKSAPNVFIISFVCKSHAMQFFENKKIRLDKNLVKFIYMIADEGKKTFNLPYFNPDLKKLELLPSPTLGGEQLVKNLLEILLIKVMRSETEKNKNDSFFPHSEEDGGNVTKRVIDFMKKHLKDSITIQDICDEVNYNKSYIFRTFKRDTGSTVMNYYNRIKIEKAKQFLREGKLNVSQIAETLAFDTPNYFSKNFRKITGYSPLQYKKIYLSSQT